MLLLFRSLHILAAFWYVAGLAGYIAMRIAALRAPSLEAVQLLIRLMHGFERFMLLPSGALLVILGLLTAWLEHWPHFALAAFALVLLLVPFAKISGLRIAKVDAALTEAAQTGRFTEALQAALRDKVLVACESAIVSIVLLILLLMLFKPG